MQKLSKTALSSTILKLLEKLKNVRYPSVQVFWDTLKQESANKINLDPHKGLILSNMQPTRELAKAFALFMSLPQDLQNKLVESIYILDSSANITEIIQKIESMLHGVSLEYRQEVRHELQGWWLDVVIDHLLGGSEEIILKAVTENQVVSISQKYTMPLPEDFELEADFDPDSEEWEKERFVRQVRAIDISEPLRRMAIEYHHRAFKQRTKWLQEGRLTFKQSEDYEKQLTDFWEEFCSDIGEDMIDRYHCQLDDMDESQLKKFGKELYKQIRRCDKKISPSITANYMTQGSYHMLADELDLETNIPRVYWHPKFHELDNDTC